jgi:predicted permease
MLAEVLVVTTAAGGAGLATAVWWTAVVRQWLRIELPLWMDIHLDYRVLLFGLVLTVIVGVVTGLYPALAYSRVDLAATMKESTRGSSRGKTSVKLRSALAVGEISLAVLLLIVAGLLVKIFLRLQQTDIGFTRERALTFRTDPPWVRYNKVEQTALFYERALEQLRGIPGVVAGAANHSLPLALNQNYGKPSVAVEGQSVDEQQHNPFVNVQIVSTGYFDVMGIGIRQGRGFSVDDRIGTTPVAVISRPLARRLFGDGNPVGRRIQLPGLLSALNESKPEWLVVTGVAEGVRSESLLAEPGYDIYLSNQQQFAGDTFFVLRTVRDPMSIAGEVARAIQQVDPDQPVFDLRPLDSRIDDTIWQRRMAGSLSLCFGLLALVLAAIGIYGVLSHLVAQRIREIGIRLALGATPRSVWWLVVREGLTKACAGLAIGLGAALLLSRFLGSVLYRVSSYDPAVLASAAAVTVLVAVAACAVPAGFAASTSPIAALRSE